MREVLSDRSDAFRGLIAHPRERPLSQQDQIVRAIGMDIVSGVIPPGERIPAEAELLARFEVSRSVLREALKTLTAKGLLVVRAHIGARVRDPAHWSTLDPDLLAWRLEAGLDPAFRDHLQDIRVSLAATAASLAAKHRTERDIAAMSSALTAFERAGGRPRDQSAAHLAFQASVSRASGNPVLQSICDLIEAAVIGTISPNPSVVREGTALIDRIVKRDPTGAADLMRATLS